MKLHKIKKIIFLIAIFGPWFFAISVNAAGCGYGCYEAYSDYNKTIAPCTNIGGTIGTTFGPNAQCTGAPNCGLYQTPVCCCTGEDNFIVPSNEGVKQPSDDAPKFEIPDLQVDLNGLNFTQPTCTQDDNGEYICKVNWLGEYITWIYNYALKVAGVLAAIVLMAGGVLWLISSGDASKIKQASDLIIGAVTGLIILLSSYVLLITVNPELVKFRPITMGALSNKEVTELIKEKNSGQSGTYLKAGCATDQELATGVNFYATGYCQPTWANTKKFYCAIAMNCSCPPGVGLNTSQNCDEFFVTLAKAGKHYSPCNSFPKNIDYCNRTSNGETPYIGSIAGPRCSNLNYGDKVCFNGRTYTINDSGGAIQGKRIDIWTGNCAGTAAVTGTGVLTKGACGSQPAVVTGSFNGSAWISGGGKFDPNIFLQSGDASPELAQLLNCMRTKLTSGVGRISSISDSKFIGNLGVCNNAKCKGCAHKCYSCHYGGGVSTNKSYAVDFGDEENMTVLIAAAKACSSDVYTLDEDNHLHISVSKCSGK